MGAYDLDFHAWALAQADAIRRRSMNEIDWENLAEEVESLGRQQRAQLLSRLVVLVQHLLKWEHQPERRGTSWRRTIVEQRKRIPLYVEQNPSLKAVIGDVFHDAYDVARAVAATEMRLLEDDLPARPEFTLAQALDKAWPPGFTDRDA